MLKRIFALTISLCCFSASAMPLEQYSNCPQALPSNHPKFCASFKSIAECHCIEMGLPKGMCKDTHIIYDRMIAMFGSLQKACEYQKDTTVQICIDDWNCYRLGGRDSQGRLCSASGKACES